MCSIQNLMLADQIARKGKKDQFGVREHDKRRGCNILTLHNMLMDKTFTTGIYKHFTIKDPKPRLISALNYYPDRIVHHAAMIKLENMFVANFTADTYSCIRGRGISACRKKLVKALKDVKATTYYLQFDVKKFYPSIDHQALKNQLRRKIKDADLLWLLDDVIDSAPGVPIGNYLSQYFANFYLSPLDHFIKEAQRVKYYFRYADDGIILSDSKEYLHDLVAKIEAYLLVNLKLEIKANYKIKPVDDHGINFLGFVFRSTHVLLRPEIKRSWARAVWKGKNRQSVAAYEGWGKQCNSINLSKKLSHENFPRPGGKIKDPEWRQNRN